MTCLWGATLLGGGEGTLAALGTQKQSKLRDGDQRKQPQWFKNHHAKKTPIYIVLPLMPMHAQGFAQHTWQAELGDLSRWAPEGNLQIFQDGVPGPVWCLELYLEDEQAAGRWCDMLQNTRGAALAARFALSPTYHQDIQVSTNNTPVFFCASVQSLPGLVSTKAVLSFFFRKDSRRIKLCECENPCHVVGWLMAGWWPIVLV